MSEHARERYEPGGVGTRYVLLAALGALVLLAGAGGGLYAAFRIAAPDTQPPAPRIFPAPRLDAHPADELRALRAQQRRRLNEYRWANDARTLINIPIARAMDLIVKRGDAAFAPIAASGTTGNAGAGAQPGPQP